MPEIKTTFPHPIREIEHTWIPLRDGTRLAARVWLPEDAEQSPVPAILEYIPYRKSDATAQRDATRHPYFAGHGYAAVRVDMRGSGDSDGLLLDEYLPQEQADGLEVLAWIAAQPWCTGSAGIIGKSWGGFNGLQIAAHRPPALKAVISVCSTDDRYADDVHYIGGCVLASDMLGWASTMLAYNARPPDPRHVGERWRELWRQRLEQTLPFIHAWLAHQRRDEFWQQGSVCEDFAAITCPVFAVGGWADGYTNAVLRLLAGLRSPRKGLIGPWAHNYPDQGVPGPAIGFLQECLRWWDYWLKGLDTGIMAEPMLRAWMLATHPPAPGYGSWPGRWVAEAQWPASRVQPRSLHLGAGQLASGPVAAPPAQILGSQFAGQDAGVWWGMGEPGDFAPDQRMEDGLALTFDSAPLAEPVEILGFPEVDLCLASDQPNALVAVRLCDVAPTGESTLVTRGLLNLTRRESHAQPQPLEPGQPFVVTVRLDAIAYSLAPGHRWRLAISPTCWPLAWPSPAPVTLTVFTEDSRLRLPVRPPDPADDRLPPFALPEWSPPLSVDVLRPASRRRTLERDVIAQRLVLTEHGDAGRFRIEDNGLEYDSSSRQTFAIVAGQPLSASVRCEWAIEICRGAWHTRVETLSTMTADAETFHVTNALDAFEGPTRVFARTWTFAVPRDGV